MEITRANYQQVLPRIEALLPSCEFVSLDLEMTGIRGDADVERDVSLSAEAKFPTRSAAAAKYAIMQVGLCLFHRVEGTQRYEARPFNLFVFPGDLGSDVTLDTETVVNFHSKHGMDFNKWVAGIPYSNAAARRRNGAARSLALDDALEARGIGEQDQGPFARTVAAAVRFQETAAVGDTNTDTLPYFVESGSLKKLDLAFASLGLSRVQVQRGSKKLNTMRKVADPAGPPADLTTLLDLVAGSGKPVAVHNGLMDLLFLHHAVDGTPVPTLRAFKDVLHRRFPVVYDTRAIALSPALPFDPLMLPTLEGAARYYRSRGTPVSVDLPLGFEAYGQGCNRTHEAGFDALLTGELLLMLGAKLSGSSPDSPLASLDAHRNRVPVYACVDIVCLDDITGDVPMHPGPILHASFASRPTAGDAQQALRGVDNYDRFLMLGDDLLVFLRPDDRDVRGAEAVLRGTLKASTIRVLRP